MGTDRRLQQPPANPVFCYMDRKYLDIFSQIGQRFYFHILKRPKYETNISHLTPALGSPVLLQKSTQPCRLVPRRTQTSGQLALVAPWPSFHGTSNSPKKLFQPFIPLFGILSHYLHLSQVSLGLHQLPATTNNTVLIFIVFYQKASLRNGARIAYSYTLFSWVVHFSFPYTQTSTVSDEMTVTSRRKGRSVLKEAKEKDRGAGFWIYYLLCRQSPVSSSGEDTNIKEAFLKI